MVAQSGDWPSCHCKTYCRQATDVGTAAGNAVISSISETRIWITVPQWALKIYELWELHQLGMLPRVQHRVHGTADPGIAASLQGDQRHLVVRIGTMTCVTALNVEVAEVFTGSYIHIGVCALEGRLQCHDRRIVWGDVLERGVPNLVRFIPEFLECPRDDFTLFHPDLPTCYYYRFGLQHSSSADGFCGLGGVVCLRINSITIGKWG